MRHSDNFVIWTQLCKPLVCADFRPHPHAHRTPARVRARAHARTLKVWSYYYRPSNGSCIWNGSIFSSIKSKYDMKLIVDSFTCSYLCSHIVTFLCTYVGMTIFMTHLRVTILMSSYLLERVKIIKRSDHQCGRRGCNGRQPYWRLPFKYVIPFREGKDH